MAARLRFVVCLASMLPLAGPAPPAVAGPYRSDANHFTFDLPADWAAMPADEVSRINQAVGQLNPSSMVRYDAGFRPARGGPGGYPYVLLQTIPGKLKGASYDEIERSLTREAPAGSPLPPGRSPKLPGTSASGRPPWTAGATAGCSGST